MSLKCVLVGIRHQERNGVKETSINKRRSRRSDRRPCVERLDEAGIFAGVRKKEIREGKKEIGPPFQSFFF
jgi:hypothetical protein